MIHPAVGEQWRVKIPILLSTIEASGNPETSQDNVWWEHLLLKFLNMTLKSIADDAWSSQLSLELQHQTASYACSSPEKHVVTILAFSAEGHLDLTLGTLEDFGAALSKVQVSGIVGRLQDYHQGKRARTHRALILAYGRIAVHGPRTQLLPRVEHDLTRKVLQYYMTSCQVRAWDCTMSGRGLPWD
ncbi:maestro heat-like repeat-containing protein family member 2B [Alligator mississippiensis]|uniref:maestro heat-like repeat-containing protein family member 2B n=1 Tax=Alligator mississippiensis TaxID=8496 RepID=UPI002877DA7D|nr:maestro heat-like repeat-containing protein family member 2B [Alligator mississippiensis]